MKTYGFFASTLVRSSRTSSTWRIQAIGHTIPPDWGSIGASGGVEDSKHILRIADIPLCLVSKRRSRLVRSAVDVNAVSRFCSATFSYEEDQFCSLAIVHYSGLIALLLAWPRQTENYPCRRRRLMQQFLRSLLFIARCLMKPLALSVKQNM